MEGSQWTAPIWPKFAPRSEDKRRDFHYSYPDWGNIGPATAALAQCTDLQMESSKAPSSSCFTTLKDIQKKFPLKTTCQFSYPLLHPQRSYSHSCVQHPLVGNCIDVVEVGDQSTVVHVDLTSAKQQAVVASRLRPGRYYQKDEPITDDPFFHLEKQDNILVDHVYQVVSKSYHNDVHVLVRCPTAVHVAALGQSGFARDTIKSFDSSLTSDAALSSIVPGLWSLVTANGEVSLFDAEAREPLWMTCCLRSRNSKNESARTFGCDFGRHPLNLFVRNEGQLWLYDTRKSPDFPGPLFDLKKIEEYASAQENICSFIPCSDQPHVYIVMDESVYVVDDRQPKTPVMHWRHMLPESPTFSALKRFESLEILMLSCTQNKEISMICSEWECGMQQCFGVGLPHHFPTVRDTAAFAHSRCLWFTSQVQERLEESTWLGTALLSHPVESDRLLFISLHNTGDIFSHPFQSLQTKTNSTLSIEKKQGETMLDKWERDVVEVSTHNWLFQNVKYFDVSGFFHQVLNKQSCGYVEEILDGLPEIKLNHLNDKTNSSNSMQILASKTNKNKQVSPNTKKAAKSCLKIIEKVEKSTDCNGENFHKKTSNIWNLKDQVQKYKSNWASKSSRARSWNRSLMDAYVIDPNADPFCDRYIHSNDSVTENCLNKFLPKDMIADLKIDKIKSCEDFLASKITSLWLGEHNTSVRDEKAGIEQHETFDKRLSNLIGIPTTKRKHGFQYHTAPVDLSDVSARLNMLYQVRNEPSPEPYETSGYPSASILESSQSASVKSKGTLKKKKKKRLDGF
ncbi:uncharacterized protein LOC123515979 [Portunus trituberculatus]|uniref:uncharacterized protein LOC123515979 n=1 Tax=Portunus trituberculatus TaxID=210409 RepID=UPI001E1CCFE4|nr:uncharacterized protein LOC123515979 [Portunus trituberculatus]XP_045130873.1 uncharacterized protein LOC123515979 [Portunus trituberculatus]